MLLDVRFEQGLCMTCNNAESCYYRASRGPGLFCEMFDDYAVPVSVAIERKAPHLAEPASGFRLSKEDASSYAGLCMNCDHRRTCGHAEGESGVWHCEEYM